MKTRVKLLGRVEPRLWLRQFPERIPQWDGCEFIFDPDARDYDWLVVYDDLPAVAGERFSRRREVLACSRAHTLLVTTEPPSIKTYGRAFVGQFEWVLTSQPKWAIPHPGRIYSQPALRWFYGAGQNHEIDFDTLVREPALDKSRDLATICSTKKQRHTRHNRRYHFTQALRKRLPELDLYGRGVQDVDDKAQTLAPYRYHLAIENFRGEHHWTEKLADAFLGVTLPFYDGCPNAQEYFPAESFVPIDSDDVEGAAATIRRCIATQEFEKRLPYILQARDRVLWEYNLFAVLAREIRARTSQSREARERGGLLLSRHLLRREHPWVAVQQVVDKCRIRCHGFLCGYEAKGGE